jgi:hypothetical protein
MKTSDILNNQLDTLTTELEELNKTIKKKNQENIKSMSDSINLIEKLDIKEPEGVAGVGSSSSRHQQKQIFQSKEWINDRIVKATEELNKNGEISDESNRKAQAKIKELANFQPSKEVDSLIAECTKITDLYSEQIEQKDSPIISQQNELIQKIAIISSLYEKNEDRDEKILKRIEKIHTLDVEVDETITKYVLNAINKMENAYSLEPTEETIAVREMIKKNGSKVLNNIEDSKPNSSSDLNIIREKIVKEIEDSDKDFSSDRTKALIQSLKNGETDKLREYLNPPEITESIKNSREDFNNKVYFEENDFSELKKENKQSKASDFGDLEALMTQDTVNKTEEFKPILNKVMAEIEANAKEQWVKKINSPKSIEDLENLNNQGAAVLPLSEITRNSLAVLNDLENAIEDRGFNNFTKRKSDEITDIIENMEDQGELKESFLTKLEEIKKGIVKLKDTNDYQAGLRQFEEDFTRSLTENDMDSEAALNDLQEEDNIILYLGDYVEKHGDPDASMDKTEIISLMKLKASYEETDAIIERAHILYKNEGVKFEGQPPKVKEILKHSLENPELYNIPDDKISSIRAKMDSYGEEAIELNSMNGWITPATEEHIKQNTFDIDGLPNLNTMQIKQYLEDLKERTSSDQYKEVKKAQAPGYIIQMEKKVQDSKTEDLQKLRLEYLLVSIREGTFKEKINEYDNEKLSKDLAKIEEIVSESSVPYIPSFIMKEIKNDVAKTAEEDGISFKIYKNDGDIVQIDISADENKITQLLQHMSENMDVFNNKKDFLKLYQQGEISFYKEGATPDRNLEKAILERVSKAFDSFPEGVNKEDVEFASKEFDNPAPYTKLLSLLEPSEYAQIMLSDHKNRKGNLKELLDSKHIGKPREPGSNEPFILKDISGEEHEISHRQMRHFQKKLWPYFVSQGQPSYEANQVTELNPGNDEKITKIQKENDLSDNFLNDIATKPLSEIKPEDIKALQMMKRNRSPDGPLGENEIKVLFKDSDIVMRKISIIKDSIQEAETGIKSGHLKVINNKDREDMADKLKSKYSNDTEKFEDNITELREDFDLKRSLTERESNIRTSKTKEELIANTRDALHGDATNPSEKGIFKKAKERGYKNIKLLIGALKKGGIKTIIKTIGKDAVSSIALTIARNSPSAFENLLPFQDQIKKHRDELESARIKSLNTFTETHILLDNEHLVKNRLSTLAVKDYTSNADQKDYQKGGLIEDAFPTPSNQKSTELFKGVISGKIVSPLQESMKGIRGNNTTLGPIKVLPDFLNKMSSYIDKDGIPTNKCPPEMANTILSKIAEDKKKYKELRRKLILSVLKEAKMDQENAPIRIELQLEAIRLLRSSEKNEDGKPLFRPTEMMNITKSLLGQDISFAANEYGVVLEKEEAKLTQTQNNTEERETAHTTELQMKDKKGQIITFLVNTENKGDPKYKFPEGGAAPIDPQTNEPYKLDANQIDLFEVLELYYENSDKNYKGHFNKIVKTATANNQQFNKGEEIDADFLVKKVMEIIKTKPKKAKEILDMVDITNKDAYYKIEEELQQSAKEEEFENESLPRPENVLWISDEDWAVIKKELIKEKVYEKFKISVKDITEGTDNEMIAFLNDTRPNKFISNFKNKELQLGALMRLVDKVEQWKKPEIKKQEDSKKANQKSGIKQDGPK